MIQAILFTPVCSIGCNILSDQIDLVDTNLLEKTGIVQNVFDWTADKAAFDARNGTKSTGAMAAVGDFKIAAAALNGCVGGSGSVLEFRITQVGTNCNSFFQAANQGNDILQAACADQTVDAWLGL